MLLALLVIFGAFYRYSRTDAFRHGDLRRASLGFLMIIGPFFGVHPRRPEPEPATISTPRDDAEDPLNALGVRLPEEPGSDGDGTGSQP